MNRKPPVHWGNTWNRGRKHTKPRMTKKRLALKAAMEAYEKAHPKQPNSRVLLAMTNPYKVEPGQAWKNVDSRAGINSKAGPVAVVVARVEPPYAFCYWADVNGNVDEEKEIKVSRLRLDLFRPKERKATSWSGGSRGWKRILVDNQTVE